MTLQLVTVIAAAEVCYSFLPEEKILPVCFVIHQRAITLLNCTKADDGLSDVCWYAFMERKETARQINKIIGGVGANKEK